MSAGSNSGRAVIPLRYRRPTPEVGVIDDYVVMSQEIRPCGMGEEVRPNEIDSRKDGASAQDSKGPVNVDVATEIALAKLSEVPVKLSAQAVRATGRSTPSMRAGRGKFDKTFNDSGTSLPYKLDTSRNQSQVYKFVGNTYAAAYMLSSTTIEVDMAGATTLSELGNASTFSALFDQYMIELIEIWLMPRTSTQIGVTGYTGLLCSVVDYDDDATITQAQALEYGNVLCSHGIDGHYRRYVPHCALAAYSGTFTSYANAAHQWIDVASTGVKHYGHKFTISVTDAPYTFDILKRVHVKFRNVR